MNLQLRKAKTGFVFRWGNSFPLKAMYLLWYKRNQGNHSIVSLKFDNFKRDYPTFWITYAYKNIRYVCHCNAITNTMNPTSPIQFWRFYLCSWDIHKNLQCSVYIFVQYSLSCTDIVLVNCILYWLIQITNTNKLNGEQQYCMTYRTYDML